MVSASDWSKLMTFVGQLVDELRRRDIVQRLAVVTYTGRVHVALPLDHHHLDTITSLPFTIGPGRNISGALRLTRTEVQVQFHRRLLLWAPRLNSLVKPTVLLRFRISQTVPSGVFIHPAVWPQ